MDEGDLTGVWLPEGGLAKLPNDQVDFWVEQVEIRVFASPIGYTLTSSGLPSLNWDMFYKFL